MKEKRSAKSLNFNNKEAEDVIKAFLQVNPRKMTESEKEQLKINFEKEEKKK